MRTRWSVAFGLAIALAGCNTPSAPSWTADYLFPLNFPAVDLSGLPGGIIPVDTVEFTTPVASQEVTGIVGQILQSDDLTGLTAEVIVATNLDITGTIDLSVAPSTGALFDPSQSLTTTINVADGADTVVVPVNLDLFRTATDLFFQADVTIAGQGGNITIPAGTNIDVRVNFIGTILVSK